MGQPGLPAGEEAADHGRRRAAPTGADAGCGRWNCRRLADEIGLRDLGVPLPAGHEQVEQDRAPDVLPHHRELAGPAADQPRSRRAQTIAATRTRAGLRVAAELDTATIPVGVRDQPRPASRTADPPACPRTAPGTTPSSPPARPGGHPARTPLSPATWPSSQALAMLADPRLTGMSRRRTRHAGPPAWHPAAGRPGRTAQIPPARRSPPPGHRPNPRPLLLSDVRRASCSP